MISMFDTDLKSDRAKLIELIREHQRAKKNFAIQDAYKLIYQSVFGIGHILDHPAMAHSYLIQEYESIAAVEDEPLIENISIDEELVRLNLRPYKFLNSDLNRLFHAMLSSAAEIAGSLEKFLSLWNQFKQAVWGEKLNFDKPELKIFDRQVKSEHYPVRHHSAGYRAANRPAYRVLKRQHAMQLLA